MCARVTRFPGHQRLPCIPHTCSRVCEQAPAATPHQRQLPQLLPPRRVRQHQLLQRQHVAHREEQRPGGWSRGSNERAKAETILKGKQTSSIQSKRSTCGLTTLLYAQRCHTLCAMHGKSVLKASCAVVPWWGLAFYDRWRAQGSPCECTAPGAAPGQANYNTALTCRAWSCWRYPMR